MTQADTSLGKVTAAAGDRSRLRLLRLIGLFLLLQALGLIALCIYLITRLNWESLDLPQGPWSEETIQKLPIEYTEAIYSSALFLPLTILIVLAAISFLLLRQRGWLLAMLMQGLTLMVCVIFYFWRSPFFVYPIMAYCILMVLYLNSYEVRLTFLSKLSQEKELGAIKN